MFTYSIRVALEVYKTPLTCIDTDVFVQKENKSYVI